MQLFNVVVFLSGLFLKKNRFHKYIIWFDIICKICVGFLIGNIDAYLKQIGMISPFAKQYFSTNSGAILFV